jgi:hypothetical protein
MDSLFSFPVGLFHPLQHAGLARRTPDRPSLGGMRSTTATLIGIESVGYRSSRAIVVWANARGQSNNSDTSLPAMFLRVTVPHQNHRN